MLRGVSLRKRPRPVDSVTEATWDEALSQLGGIIKQPLTPLDNACHAHSARGHRWERDAQRIKRFALDGLIDHDGVGKWRSS